MWFYHLVHLCILNKKWTKSERLPWTTSTDISCGPLRRRPRGKLAEGERYCSCLPCFLPSLTPPDFSDGLLAVRFSALLRWPQYTPIPLILRSGIDGLQLVALWEGGKDHLSDRPLDKNALKYRQRRVNYFPRRCCVAFGGCIIRRDALVTVAIRAVLAKRCYLPLCSSLCHAAGGMVSR